MAAKCLCMPCTQRYDCRARRVETLAAYSAPSLAGGYRCVPFGAVRIGKPSAGHLYLAREHRLRATQGDSTRDGPPDVFARFRGENPSVRPDGGRQFNWGKLRPIDGQSVPPPMTRTGTPNGESGVVTIGYPTTAAGRVSGSPIMAFGIPWEPGGHGCRAVGPCVDDP
jgi:hypothetical protein